MGNGIPLPYYQVVSYVAKISTRYIHELDETGSHDEEKNSCD